MASVQTKNWAQSEGLGALSEGRENLLGRKEPRRIIIEDLCASEKKKKKRWSWGHKGHFKKQKLMDASRKLCLLSEGQTRVRELIEELKERSYLCNS